MQIAIETDSSKPSMQSTKQPKSIDISDWLAQRMKVAQSMFPHSQLTPETAAVFLSEWEVIVEETGAEAFELALTRAMRASEFFPSVATIRKHAGLTAEIRAKCEADAAWDWIQNWIAKWYGLLPEYKGRDPQTGEMQFETGPKIPKRIDYAIRQAGGMDAIARTELKSEPFIRLRFNEAFERAEVADLYALQFPELGGVKLIDCEKPFVKQLPARQHKGLLKVTPTPLNDEELDARRLELQRQAAQLLDAQIS